jgi:hypothetical protein
MNKKALCLLGLFLWHAEALAETQKWSIVGGKTIGQGAVAIDAGVGWPGLHAGLAYGVLSKVDFGMRFSFNWGVEGSVRSVHPGLKLQGLTKVGLFDNGFLSFALKFEPGFLTYFYSGHTMWGFAFPVGAQLGLVVAPPIVVGIHLELPMFLTFGRGSSLQIPLLMGGGVEYFFNSRFLADFVLKMGPSFNSRGGSAIFVMEAKVGIAYRF